MLRRLHSTCTRIHIQKFSSVSSSLAQSRRIRGTYTTSKFPLLVHPCGGSDENWLGAFGKTFAVLVVGLLGSFQSNQCCGVIGVVGEETNASEILLEGLTILQNRGYDSAGMCTISKNSNSFVTTKFANSSKGGLHQGDGDSIAKLRRGSEAHLSSSVGIAHTRWATQGHKTDANAHPHQDQRGRISLVHNGSILNAREIRKKLHASGIVFRSHTDSEVIAQLIGYHMDSNKTTSVLEATKLALAELTGTWGVVLLAHDTPNELVVAAHGSPMVIGIGDNQVYVASEVSAFRRHTDNVVELSDGEVVLVRPDAQTPFDRSRIRTMDEKQLHQLLTSPAPWPHWTLREIEEQPDAIYRALNFGGRMTQYGVTMGGLSLQRAKMLEIQDLLITGCGSSYNAGTYGANLMRSLEAFRYVEVLEATNLYQNVIPRVGGGILAVSQSGETKAVLDAIQSCKVPAFSVVNGVGSRLAQLTKVGAYQNAGPENGVTSTKSFSTQVTVMALIACWFAQHRDYAPDSRQANLIQALQRLPASFRQALSCRSICSDVAKVLQNCDSCFVVGSEAEMPAVLEGALKLKELGCIHARPWNGTENDLPLSSVFLNNAVPFIFIIVDNEQNSSLQALASKLYKIGHPVIVITDDSNVCHNTCTHRIVIPENGPLTALVAVTPLQLIAYELALLIGRNPDIPRNLSKAVKD